MTSPAYPVSLDALANPGATTETDDTGFELDIVVSRLQNIAMALEAKLGIGPSTPPSTAAVLRQTASGASAWGALQAGDVGSGAPGSVLQAASSGIGLWAPFPRRNLLTNGGMRVHQRATLSTAKTAVDGIYQVSDRWKSIWNGGGGAVNIYAYQGGPSGNQAGTLPRSILSLSQGNSAKNGFLQILEGADTVPVVGGNVSLQAKLFNSGGYTDLRIAVLGWTGAADAVSYPFSAYGADGVNPTLTANWAYLATPVNLGATAVWTTYKVENVAIPATINNLAVFVWSNNAVQAASQAWYVSEVQLEAGAVCTPFEHVPFALDYQRCQRYYQKTYAHDVIPGTATPTGEIIGQAAGALAGSAGGIVIPLAATPPLLGVRMRTTPAVTVYSTTGTAGAVRVAGAADRTGVTVVSGSDRFYLEYFTIDTSSAVAIADRAQLQAHATAAAEL